MSRIWDFLFVAKRAADADGGSNAVGGKKEKGGGGAWIFLFTFFFFLTKVSLATAAAAKTNQKSIGATICIGQEIICLPYAGFFNATFGFRGTVYSAVQW